MGKEYWFHNFEVIRLHIDTIFFSHQLYSLFVQIFFFLILICKNTCCLEQFWSFVFWKDLITPSLLCLPCNFKVSLYERVFSENHEVSLRFSQAMLPHE